MLILDIHIIKKEKEKEDEIQVSNNEPIILFDIFRAIQVIGYIYYFMLFSQIIRMLRRKNIHLRGFDGFIFVFHVFKIGWLIPNSNIFFSLFFVFIFYFTFASFIFVNIVLEKKYICGLYC